MATIELGLKVALRGFERIVLVGGNGFPAGVYLPVARRLKEAYRCDVQTVEVHDKYNGHGWTEMVDHVKSYVGSGTSNNTLLIGHSLGGSLSVAALRNGGKAAKLVVFDPPMFSPVTRMVLHVGRFLDAGPLQKIVRTTAKRRNQWDSRDEAIEYLSTRFPLHTFSPEVLYAFKHHGLKDNEDGSVSLMFTPETEAGIFHDTPTEIDPFWRRPHYSTVGLYPSRSPIPDKMRSQHGVYYYSLKNEFAKRHDLQWTANTHPYMRFEPCASHFSILEEPEGTVNVLYDHMSI
eukprot:TRINITY_DN38636_c0_g1_i1.p1 TRINITY_DN38636_c0_g1~~TRINITY_DN38636_c0_g1_i1.p1  ORF type:complete len:299 (+),score=54.40 TRINITY_DN38636_c0_g1_i1:30-899(+)